MGVPCLLAKGLVDVDVVVHKYSLEDLVPTGKSLGNGAFGKVTKVMHRTTGEVLAMKTIPKDKMRMPTMKEHIDREVRVQQRLYHPNILRLYECVEDKLEIHLILEYAKGGTLFAELKRHGRFEEPEGGFVWASVTQAIDYLHDEGVVHRDIKPENILLCDNGVAKIADFGWCAELEDQLRNTFCGTTDYIAPEMIEGEPHDHAVDIWALGVLLYELLANRAPFSSGSQGAAMLRIAKVDVQYPDLMSRLACDLIGKLLVKDKDQRLPLKRALTHPLVPSSSRLEASSRTRFGRQGTRCEQAAGETGASRANSKAAGKSGRRGWKLAGLPKMAGYSKRVSSASGSSDPLSDTRRSDGSSLCSIYTPAAARRQKHEDPLARSAPTTRSQDCGAPARTHRTSTMSGDMDKDMRAPSLIASTTYPGEDEDCGARSTSPTPSCRDVDEDYLEVLHSQSSQSFRIHSMPPGDNDKDFARPGKKAAKILAHMSTQEFLELQKRANTLAWKCLCGNVYLPDEIFCRRCGQERPCAMDCKPPNEHSQITELVDETYASQVAVDESAQGRLPRRRSSVDSSKYDDCFVDSFGCEEDSPGQNPRPGILRSSTTGATTSTSCSDFAIEFGVDSPTKPRAPARVQVNEGLPGGQPASPHAATEADMDATVDAVGVYERADANELAFSMNVEVYRSDPQLRAATPAGTATSSLSEFAFELDMISPGRRRVHS